MISIAMAAYNGEKYLREQLDSILRQTVQDFELVICDDCSTDGTVRILEEYMQKDSRIKVFVNKENLGFVKNFEKAIKLCSGEYIALSDQDDVWLPEHLEILMRNIKENILACSNAVFMDSKGNRLSENVKVDFYVSNNEDEQFFQLLHNNFVQGCTILFKKNLVPFIIPMPNSVEYHDYWIAFIASLYGTIAYISEPLVQYRRHAKTVTMSNSRSLKDKVRDFFYKNGIDSILKRKVFLAMLNDVHLDSCKKKIYDNARCYFDSILKNSNKIWCIKYFIRNYKLIYSTGKYTLFLPRFFKLLFIFPFLRLFSSKSIESTGSHNTRI